MKSTRIKHYATKWQVNSAQWQRLGVITANEMVALKAQVNSNLGFQPVALSHYTHPRLRHWAELRQASSPAQCNDF